MIMASNCSCSPSSSSDDASNQPVVEIGVYIALASGVLMLMGGHHVWKGTRARRWWFPCGDLLSLNAGTLSVLAVATKLPNDLTTPMPSPVDQLSKLSGGALVCAVMAAAMPSLGTMKSRHGGELASNMAALALLVVTLLVNVAMQIHSGIISAFVPEHVVVLVSTALLFLLLCTLALAVPAMESDVKDILHSTRPSSSSSSPSPPSLDAAPAASSPSSSDATAASDSSSQSDDAWTSLAEEARTSWMAALTGDLQFVAARSPVAASAATMAAVSLLALLSAIARSGALDHRRPSSMQTSSVYGWTTFPILVLQLAAVLLCLVPSVMRGCRAVLYSSQSSMAIEPFWQQVIVDFKFKPVAISPTDPKRRRIRKLAQLWKERLCDAFMWMEGLLVQVSKSICMAFSCVSRLYPRPEHRKNPQQIERIVSLHGEDPLKLWHITKPLADVSHFIEKGKRCEMSTLVKLLKHGGDQSGNYSKDVALVLGAYQGMQDNLDTLSWSLTIVTLLALMTALECESASSCSKSQEAIDAFTQALDMVALVDKHYSVPKKPWEGAMQVVWACLESQLKWLHVDLTSIPKKGSVIFHLEVIAKDIIGATPTTQARLTSEQVAAHILLKLMESLEPLDPSISKLGDIIANMLATCLLNFPMALNHEIHKTLHHGELKKVERGLYFLGKGRQLWHELNWSHSSNLSPLHGVIRAWIEHP